MAEKCSSVEGGSGVVFVHLKILQIFVVVLLQCWGSVKVKDYFIIYEYLKVLVTRSLKLLSLIHI